MMSSTINDEFDPLVRPSTVSKFAAAMASFCRSVALVSGSELNKTGTLPPTGNLKPNFRGSPQSRHAGKSAVKTQNKVFEKEKSK